MTRSRNTAPKALATVRTEPAFDPVAAAPEPEPEIETSVVQAVQKAFNIPEDEALAVRRLRASLIEKLFTPERALNSWTDLKATN